MSSSLTRFPRIKRQTCRFYGLAALVNLKRLDRIELGLPAEEETEAGNDEEEGGDDASVAGSSVSGTRAEPKVDDYMFDPEAAAQRKAIGELARRSRLRAVIEADIRREWRHKSTSRLV